MALFDTLNSRLAILELDVGSLPAPDGTLDSADAREILGLFPIASSTSSGGGTPSPTPTTGPFTAREVILHVRDMHVAFTKEDVPTSLLLRFLARRYRRLLGKIIEIRPEVLEGLALVTASPGALLTFPTIALPARLYVQRVEAQLIADPSPSGSVGVEMVDRSVLRWAHRFPVASISGNTLVLGGVARDWISYASVSVVYIPSPGIALSEPSALVVPEDALDVLVNGLAADAAQRVAGLSPNIGIDPVAYAQLAAASEAEYLGSLTNQMRPEVIRTIEVW